MSTRPQDDERENRIEMEIVVDAYDGEEQRMGWYYYLEDNLNFPFKANWDGDEIEVISMSSEDDCIDEMVVEIRDREDEGEDIFSVPLFNIEPSDADAKTMEAIADWKYWVDRGYTFEE